jgi:hypothetical protein
LLNANLFGFACQDEELLEDVYNMIAIELGKNEESIPLEQAKQQLRKKQIITDVSC